MKLIRNISILIFSVFLLQSCMMPFGMTGMGDMGGMHGSRENINQDFKINLSSMNGELSQSVELIVSEFNRNSKFYIKTEDLERGSVLDNYYAELTLYRVPFAGASLNDIFRNKISDDIPFSSLKSDEQLATYYLLEPGSYYFQVTIYSINKSRLDSPVKFGYAINYNDDNRNTESGLYDLNYWVIGATMLGIMAVFMTVGF